MSAHLTQGRSLILPCVMVNGHKLRMIDLAKPIALALLDEEQVTDVFLIAWSAKFDLPRRHSLKS